MDVPLPGMVDYPGPNLEEPPDDPVYGGVFPLLDSVFHLSTTVLVVITLCASISAEQASPGLSLAPEAPVFYSPSIFPTIVFITSVEPA